MRIIKEGKIPEAKEYTVHCSRCGTVFACFEKEFINHFYDQKDQVWINQIDCPICKGRCGVY